METVNSPRLRESYLKKCGVAEMFSPKHMPHFLLLHYFPGELLTTPFSPSVYFQLIVDGDLLLYDMPDEASTVSLQTTYVDLKMLGEMELLDTSFTPFFVEAKSDVYTLALHLDSHREQLLQDPVFLRCLCRSLAEKLNGAVVSSRRMPLRTMVEASLRHSKPGERITDIGRIAESLNVSNRQLLRVLKEYCELGVLKHEQKGVYVVLRKP